MDRTLLLVSSTDDTVRRVRATLEPLRYTVTHLRTLASCIKVMGGAELVLLDVADCVESLSELKSYCPEATVLMVCDREHIAEAIEEGAYHVLRRPVDAHELTAAVKNALLSISMRGRLDSLGTHHSPALPKGNGQGIQEAIERARKAAQRSTAVLIHGESGNGKELLAHAIHALSPRKYGPFVTAGVSDKPLHRELFGMPKHPGLLFSAESGTLLIKNAHRLSSDSLDALNDFLKSRTTPEGVRPDVRIIVTSDRYDREFPLYGRFRSVIVLPPLRERREDIEVLAGEFLAEAVSLFDLGSRRFSKDSLMLLQSLQWPGNVSELKTTVQRAALLCRDVVIEPRHITLDDGSTHCSIEDFLEAKLSRYIKELVSHEMSGLHEAVMHEVEKTLIEMVLKETGNNQARSAHTLGITRNTLRTRMKVYGLNGFGHKETPTNGGKKPRSKSAPVSTAKKTMAERVSA